MQVSKTVKSAKSCYQGKPIQCINYQCWNISGRQRVYCILRMSHSLHVK